MEANSFPTDNDVGAVPQSNHMSLRQSLLTVLLSKLADVIFDPSARISIDEGRRRGRCALGRQDAVWFFLQLGG